MKKTVDEIVLEVIDGKWGNGLERQQQLVAAGYDYVEVQQKVCDLIKSGNFNIKN